MGIQRVYGKGAHPLWWTGSPAARGKKKLAASSMRHEAKIAYYAFDVIRFFVPYAARLKLRGRVAR